MYPSKKLFHFIFAWEID